MAGTFTGNEPIGRIVADFPGASNLFKAHKIDFCCGGDRALSTVLKQMQLDEADFLKQLQALYEEARERNDRGTDWQQATSKELIDHIIEKHHAYLVRELPVLSEFVTKVFRVHGPGHPELGELHRLYHQMKLELEHHLVAEEESVFPFIVAYEQSHAPEAREQAARQIDLLESDHSGVGELLKRMRTITNDYELPEGACRTYTLVFQKLQELEADLFEHIHLENNILFPRLVTL